MNIYNIIKSRSAIQDLHDPSANVRYYAVQYLSRNSKHPKAIKYLEEALADSNINVCREAIAGLQKRGSKQAVPILLKFIFNKNAKYTIIEGKNQQAL